MPGDLDSEIEWIAATVPGTAAGALRDAGLWAWGTEDEERLDGRDWWFRCEFAAPKDKGPWELALDGLATLADVWLNGEHLLRSDNMFLAHRLELGSLEPVNELVIRCAALGPVLRTRHPRPRWKSRLVRHQSLRWYRTTLLGRMPGWSRWAAPVGPWRPVGLRARPRPVAVTARALRAVCDQVGDGGAVIIELELTLTGAVPAEARLHAGPECVPAVLEIAGGGASARVAGEVHLPAVERWWPHTHGAQPLYPVVLELGGTRIPLGRVGFREIKLDRAGGAFTLRINEIPVFCRGACWGPPDGVSLAAPDVDVRAAVELARAAGMNMLRVAGYATYEGPAFWNACDELGVLVWQDCMLASVDPPEGLAFGTALEAELRQVFGELRGRPALAVACGSSETYQQGSMFGLSPESWRSAVLEETIPRILADVVPDVPYVPSTPSGGPRPIVPDEGVAHYFGVGAYLRAPSDARLAGVRFAAECLSFGTPPEPETVDEAFGGAGGAGHDPRWKQVVARDAGAPWDFEDVRDFYVRELWGVDPLAVRYADPERGLDLGRAAVAELMSTVIADWRRAGSHCAGALILCWQDLWPGAGWGVVDALGRTKAPLYALRRVFAPTTVLIADDGLSGLRLHVVNDGPEPFSGTLALRVWSAAGAELEQAERTVDVEPHGAREWDAEELLGGFRDLNRAYRFSPLAHDVVSAELRDADRRPAGEAVHLAGGPARPRLPDLGLVARAARGDDGQWSLCVETRLFAQYVAIDAPGFTPEDSWFHLLPGASRTLRLEARDVGRRLSGSVRALNGPATRIAVEREARP